MKYIIYALLIPLVIVLYICKFKFILIVLGLIFIITAFIFHDGMVNDHGGFAVFIILSILGIVAGVYFQKVLLCSILGLVISLIIQNIWSDFWENREIEKSVKATVERETRIVESKRINKSLSRCINRYLKDGTIYNNYYGYSNYSCCSSEINSQICKLIIRFKEDLLMCVSDERYYTDYYTGKGIIRKVLIESVIVYSLYEKYREEEIEFAERDRANTAIVEHYGGNNLENWRVILEDNGFYYEVQKEDSTPNNYFTYGIIYAYVQIDD